MDESDGKDLALHLWGPEFDCRASISKIIIVKNVVAKAYNPSAGEGRTGGCPGSPVG